MRQFHNIKQDFSQRNTLQPQDLLPASRSSTDEKQTTTEPEACHLFSWKSLGTYLEGILSFMMGAKANLPTSNLGLLGSPYRRVNLHSD
jgi:hypothetical protein